MNCATCGQPIHEYDNRLVHEIVPAGPSVLVEELRPSTLVHYTDRVYHVWCYDHTIELGEPKFDENVQRLSKTVFGKYMIDRMIVQFLRSDEYKRLSEKGEGKAGMVLGVTHEFLRREFKMGTSYWTPALVLTVEVEKNKPAVTKIEMQDLTPGGMKGVDEDDKEV